MWYTITMKNKTGKTSLGSIGCLIILVAGFFFMRSFTSDFKAARERAKQAKPTQATTNQPPAQEPKPNQVNPLAETEPIIAETLFRDALRNYLNDPDSYKPGMLRHGAHPQGYAFIQEFRAKNAFGAMIKQTAGLLASTNTGKITWTFYTPEQTPDLLLEVMKFKAETDPKIKAFKESVEKAQKP